MYFAQLVTLRATLLAFLLVIPAQAIIESISCDELDTFLVNTALKDAIAVASDAWLKLSTFSANLPAQSLSTDPRQAIYAPLFKPADLPLITDYLDSIMNIESNAFKVKIYCTTDHIVLQRTRDSQEEIWADIGFYHEDDEGVKRSRGISVTKGPTPPYMSGAGTFTKLGYVSDPQTFDTSGQSHIFFSQNTLMGNTHTDMRTFQQIVTDGLAAGTNMNSLDYIRPLTRSLLHEMFHVVGGLVSPNRPTCVVLDVPNPGSNTRRAYGSFDECVSMKDNPATPSIMQAECLTALTVGLYLQIKNNPTFWSVGVVDRETLRPILPAPPQKRMAIGWIG